MKNLDCGHQPSSHEEYSTSYGINNNGKKLCYECCTKADKNRLLTDDHFIGYIDGQKLTNWPGHILGRVLYWGKNHNWSRERRYIRIIDCHGQEWYGTAALNMWANLRKVKG